MLRYQKTLEGDRPRGLSHQRILASLPGGSPSVPFGGCRFCVGRTPLRVPSAKPALAPVALLDEVIDQLARRVVHFDVERFYLTGEVVERHNGRDSDE
jgi:hypothetical protein